MKALVIGDIHGCLAELQELVKDVDRTKTRIILVGDLIDRGLDSEGVIDFVRSNNIECVKGNHELMAEEMIPYLVKDSLWAVQSADWFYNGGEEVYNNYSSPSKLLQDLTWLANLPRYIETGIQDKDGLELLVSHTWTSYKNLELSANAFNFLWSRDQPGTHKNTSKYYNIYGHTPVDYINQRKYHVGDIEVTPEPEWFDGAAAVDLGAAYNSRGRGFLCGIFFPSLDFITVQRETLIKTYH